MSPSKPCMQEGEARSVTTAGRIHINEILRLPYIDQKLTALEKHDLVVRLSCLFVAAAFIDKS